jgi:cytochrome c biogenesis protein CcdA
MSDVVGYAFALGLVALLNPCGFPLFPALLASFLRPAEDGVVVRIGRALAAGFWITVGFVAVFAVAALLAAAGAAVVAPWVAEFMILFGLGLLAVGILEVAGRTVRLPLPVMRFAEGHGPVAMLGFGAAYAVGSLSCSLPIFLAGIAGAFTRGGFAAGLGAFGAYALGMGVFTTAASVLASIAGTGVLRRLSRVTRYFPIVAGSIGILVGGYLVVYWGSVWLDPAIASAMSSGIDGWLSGIQGMIDGNARMLGALLGVAVVAATAAVAIISRTTRNRNKKGTIDAGT